MAPSVDHLLRCARRQVLAQSCRKYRPDRLPTRSIKQPMTNRHIKTLSVSPSPRPYVNLKSDKPSSQQADIIKSLKTHNVIVSAIPGSGKTATAGFYLQANPTHRVLVATYSKRLQLQAKKNLRKYSNRVDVLTYHASAGKAFGTSVPNDQIFDDLLRSGRRPKTPQHYDLVVLDEQQDMRPLIYQFVQTFLRHGSKPKLLVLGDPMQSIYGFAGSSSRYLNKADVIFANINPYPWRQHPLNVSWRLPPQAVSFVNSLLGYNHITSSRPNSMTRPEETPIYLLENTFEPKELISKIISCIQKYGPEQVAILAPSVKSRKSPLAMVSNELAGQGYAVAVSISDDSPLDDDVLRGKVVCSTYHQFKGSERDAVIVLGFDDAYYNYYAKTVEDDRLSEAMYVALTRARHELVVVHHYKNSMLPFMNWEQTRHTCQLVIPDSRHRLLGPGPGRPRAQGVVLPKNTKDPGSRAEASVKDLFRFVDEIKLKAYLEENLTVLHRKDPKAKPIKIPQTAITDRAQNQREPVADLAGTAIAAAAEMAIRGTCYSLGIYGEPPLIPSDTKGKARWYARKVTEMDAAQTGFDSRKIQLERSNSFNWLNKSLHRAVSRIQNEFKAITKSRRNGHNFTVLVEKKLSHVFNIDGEELQLVGYADFILANNNQPFKDTVWEIKCVKSLRTSHIAQVAVYAFLRAVQRKESGLPLEPTLVGMVFNATDGHSVTVSGGFKELKALVEFLIRLRFTALGEQDEEQFLEACKKIRGE